MTRRSVVVAVLLVVCAASVVANLMFGRALYAAFAELQEGRLYPLGRDSRPAPPDAVYFAVYGDSRALGWATMLRGARGVDVTNFARGGETSAQLRLRVETEPRPHARWALLQIGINDLHPLGALPALRDDVRRRLLENVDVIVERLRATTDCLIVTTVPPPGRVPLQRRLVWDHDATVTALRSLNDRLRDKAGLPGVVVFDAARTLAGDADTLPREYVDPDFFLHFNEAAYARLYDASVPGSLPGADAACGAR